MNKSIESFGGGGGPTCHVVFSREIELCLPSYIKQQLTVTSKMRNVENTSLSESC